MIHWMRAKESQKNPNIARRLLVMYKNIKKFNFSVRLIT